MTTSTVRSVTRQRKPRAKPQRFCKLVGHPDNLETSLVIRQVSASGKETVDRYTFAEIGSDSGRGFALTKEDGTVYHVELTAAGKTCECKGFTRHGHCKHADGISALVTAGKLPPVCRAFCHTDEEADVLAERYGKAA